MRITRLTWALLLPALLASNSGVMPADADFVFTGSIAATAVDGEYPNGIAAQTRSALDNLRARLAAQGLDLSHVVAMNVYLSDTRLFAAMNEVYRTYFATNPPTRATVGADLRENGMLIEIAAVAARPHVSRFIIKPAGLRSPELPYSWGVLAGTTLFVAGATSRDPDTYAPVPGDIGQQTHRVWGNIEMVLAEAGMTAADLVQCRVFLADARDFGGMNQAYRGHITEDPPGRATVRADLMNPVFKVEIQCTAERGANREIVVAEGRRRSTTLSPGVLVNDRLYLSGMLGRGPDGYAGVADQTTRTLANLRATLEAADLGFADVHDVQVYVPDIRYAGVVDSIVTAVAGDGASRSVVGVGLVSAAAEVEIMMTAGR